MALFTKDKRKDIVPRSQDSASQRPKTLLQRFSSGFSSMMPNVTLRRESSKIGLNTRPRTAPAPDRLAHFDERIRAGVADNQQMQITQIKIPTLSESTESCPYDPAAYHSFPSIEKKQCNYCGLQPPSRSAFDIPFSTKPCSDCHVRSPFSHIASTFKRSRGQGRSSSAVESSIAQLIASSSSSEEGPRIVPTAIAAERRGNPPRKASLPGGRVPSYRKLLRPSADQTSTPGKHEEFQHVLAKLSGSIEAHSKNHHHHNERPVSPKLHHLDLMPGVKDHPYVHKREVDAHMAAIRAGAPSPLRRSIDEARHTITATFSGPYSDHSRTVFYGTTTSSASARRLSPDTILQQVHARGTIVIEEGRRVGIPIDLNVELENSGLYRRRSPQEDRASTTQPPRRPDYEDSFSTMTTQAPSTIGGTRLELKGGNDRPRLRGGGNRRFRLKKWLLTCQVHDLDSDDDWPPARAPAPERIARSLRRSRGTAALPSNLSRSSTERSTTAPSLAIHQVAPAIPPLPGRSLAHPPDPSSNEHHTNGQPQPIPSIRGGAGSAVRVPPTLYWLAGGKGKPTTVSSWQKQKPKKRISGLLGMAMHGSKYGKDHTESEGGEDDMANVQAQVRSVKSNGKGSRGTAKSSKCSVKCRSSASTTSSSTTGATAGTPIARSVHEQPTHAEPMHEEPSHEHPPPIAIPIEEAVPAAAAESAPHEILAERVRIGEAGGCGNAAHTGAGNVNHGAQAGAGGEAARSRSV